MSSLVASLKSGKFALPDNDWLRRHYENTREMLLRTPDYVLVRLDGIVADLRAGEQNCRFSIQDWLSIPVLTPPYEWMWLEGILPDGRFAVQIFRDETANGFRVYASVWCENQGCAAAVGTIEFDLTQAGGFVEGTLNSRTYCDNDVDEFMLYRVIVGCHAIGRLHCKNVSLRELNNARMRMGRSPMANPSSVWREIVITDSPKFVSTGKNLFKDEALERLRVVRGHYRYAPNHPIEWFRGPFWIPEHECGNAELGRVIHEYAFA